MNILVTGSSSTLGEKLIQRLNSDKINVVGLRKSKVKSENRNLFSVNVENHDSLSKIKKKIKKIDVIVHLAAHVPKVKNTDTLEQAIKTNVLGTSNLLDVFGADIKKFIYISTIEVYGHQNWKKKITENSKTDPLSYYGLSKLISEDISILYSKKNELQLIILRIASIYGYFDTINRAIPNFINSCLTDTDLFISDREQLRDYVHVNDVVDAIYLAINSNSSGIFNIGSGKGISIKKTAETIMSLTHTSAKINYVNRNKKKSDLVLNINKSKRELKYKPKYLFPEGIEEAIECHKLNNQ